MARRSVPRWNDTTPRHTSSPRGILLGAFMVNVTVYHYPDGSMTGSVVRCSDLADTSQSLAPRLPSRYSQLATAEQQAENEQRSRRRSIAQLKRHIRAHNLRRLLTFTNGASGQGWGGPSEALDTVMRWLRSTEGRAFFRGSPVVLIAERGARGGRWHVHAAIKSGFWLPYAAIIASWSSHMERAGYHSQTGTHRFHAGDERGEHKGGFSSARWCARYMAKYVTKSLGLEMRAGVHRYRAINSPAPEAVRFRADTARLALDTLGVRDRDCFAITVAAPDGTEHLIGYAWDSGGG